MGGVTFATMFHMANDSHRFRTRDELTATGWQRPETPSSGGERAMLPLYEAKMVDATTTAPPTWSRAPPP